MQESWNESLFSLNHPDLIFYLLPYIFIALCLFAPLAFLLLRTLSLPKPPPLLKALRHAFTRLVPKRSQKKTSKPLPPNKTTPQSPMAPQKTKQAMNESEDSSLEIAILKERLSQQQRELDEEKRQKADWIVKAQKFKNQATSITQEVEPSHQQPSTFSQAENPEKFPPPNPAENTLTTEAEKILISEQAAEIQRLKSVIDEFKTQAEQVKN